jgi:hypothetical protein
MKPDTFKQILDGAPDEPGTIAEGLVGWNTRDGFCYCSVCVGRALRRGMTGQSIELSIPVWNRGLKCDACGKTYNADGTAKEERPAG